MSASTTLNALSQFCIGSTGDPQKWQGNSAMYSWNIGRDREDGVVNGVVRKLAGTDIGGIEIWVVAGSFKIAPNGDFLRFTGLSTKFQKMVLEIINQQSQEVEIQSDKVTV